tara:strand:- start:1532 stop:2650 length:1119 start_codon:yes stop_codon:yes gene_type:complete
MKKIIFITSTRADFGKIKSIITETKKSNQFKVTIVVTGMHMLKEYGNTYTEVKKTFGNNLIKFKNQKNGDHLNEILANTTKKLSSIIKKNRPDLIVYHGDRVETLSAAIVGSLNHILTAHIEGGEVSGTIDDTIRHSVTKLSHIHFVGNKKAARRVVSMGENKKKVFIIGSPDIDILLRKKLDLKKTKRRYGIKFKNYIILIWHPVTSELNNLNNNTKKLMNYLSKIGEKVIVIFPNNDPGSKIIVNNYKKYFRNKNFKFLLNARFESFITLLKGAIFIIGNSSSAIYEAPLLKTPAINIGTRQNRRLNTKSILNININDLDSKKIKNYLKNYRNPKKKYYGAGNSAKKFLKCISRKSFWETSNQKYFYENE